MAAAGSGGGGGGSDVGRRRTPGAAGVAFELIPHQQAYTSTEEARALGVDAGEVLKTLAVHASSGYALVVIPASRRLDLHLVREALGDRHARLASEEELGRDFADYQLGALPPLGGLVGAGVYVDPEVLRHDTVAFAAGTRPSRSSCEPRSCSKASRPGRCRWSSRRTGTATTRWVGGGRHSRTLRRRAASQVVPTAVACGGFAGLGFANARPWPRPRDGSAHLGRGVVPLVGRERELGALQDVLAGSGERGGALLLRAVSQPLRHRDDDLPAWAAA